MEKRNKILKLYYERKMKMVDIANKYQVSKQYVSKVVKQDKRYNIEKETRKELTKIKKAQYRNKKMKEIREKNMQMNEYLKRQHILDTIELSGGKNIISNRAFLKWNASAYKYNQNKKCYEFDRKLTKSYAVPKYIKFDI